MMSIPHRILPIDDHTAFQILIYVAHIVSIISTCHGQLSDIPSGRMLPAYEGFGAAIHHYICYGSTHGFIHGCNIL